MEVWIQFHKLMLFGYPYEIVVLWHQQPMDVTGPLTQTRQEVEDKSVQPLTEARKLQVLTPQWPQNKPHLQNG